MSRNIRKTNTGTSIAVSRDELQRLEEDLLSSRNRKRNRAVSSEQEK